MWHFGSFPWPLMPLLLLVRPFRTRELVEADEAFSSMPAKDRNIAGDDDLVALFLTYHSFLGPSSPWAPYIAALPAFVPTTAQWTEQELDMLQSQDVASDARNHHDQIESQFDKAHFAAHLRSALDGKADPSDDSMRERFLWAHSLVGSRALTLQGKKYLVPFADMFNYHPHPHPRHAAGGQHFLKYHHAKEDVFVVLADRDAAPGEQLFEDYGDNDNTLYLHHHGFVMEGNPFDCAAIRLPSLVNVR